jgi:replicative DNA helicase
MSDTTVGTTAMPSGLVPPQAIQAERAVLAAMMIGHEAIGRAVESVGEGTFYYRKHEKLFDAIVAIYNRNQPPDLLLVVEELRKRGDLEAVGGPAFVAEVSEAATTAANVEHHLKIVLEKALLRKLIKASMDIQAASYAAQDDVPQILDQAEQAIFAISDMRVRKGLLLIKDLLKSSFTEIQSLFERKQLITGVPSGYPDLDKITLGFQPGDLVVIAGRPAMGKSSFAVNIAEYAAIHAKVPTAIFSLEMSDMQLVLRMLCSQSEVDLHRLKNGYLSNSDWPRLTSGAGLLTNAPIWIDDSPSPTVLELRAKCRRLSAESKLGLVVIDYLQLIKGVGRVENRVQEISQITRSLKALAKELHIPIIALSQLSRAVDTRGTSDRRPQLSDLRESGSIEQDSDLVMFVYREEYYKPDDPAVQGLADIIVAKHRNGPTGTAKLGFIREQTRFVNVLPTMPGETEPGF